MISLDIDISEMGIYESDEQGWRGASNVVCDGNTLKELIDDATIWWIDQDGGEVMETRLIDEVVYLDRLCCIIRDEYRREIKRVSQ